MNYEHVKVTENAFVEGVESRKGEKNMWSINKRILRKIFV